MPVRASEHLDLSAALSGATALTTQREETAVSTSVSTVAIHHWDLFPDDSMKCLDGLPSFPDFERTEFAQSNLVSDAQPGHLVAAIQDPNLINPWGVAFSPKGPFWVANNHTGTATVYNVDPRTDTATVLGSGVTIATPPGQTTPAGPTRRVFNTDP